MRLLLNGTAPVWMGVWSFLTALGWVLPNHQRPWTSFHSDAWIAASLVALAPFALSMASPRLKLDRLASTLLIASLVPLAQYSFGLIHFFGHAWICSLYIAGFLVAVLIGQFWQKAHPRQLVDFLSLAIGAAAIFSVLLQLYQWLNLDGMGIWLTNSSSARPSANLAQPNQLATLLLWGTLATLWGTTRSAITPYTAILLALLLLFGVALTGSRTAWIGISFIAGFSWFWRDIWKNKSTPWAITALYVYFFACVVSLSFFDGSGAGNRIAALADNPSGSRLSAWLILFDALSRRPFFGYGWGQVAEAHISVALDHSALNVLFAHSHNIFFDLLLWCGIPFGILLSIVLVKWIWRKFMSIKGQENAVIFMFIFVFANHSLLELPFQYAYFLIPAGLFIGSAGALDDGRSGLLTLGRRGIGLLFALIFVMYSITVIDYFRVERSYETLRMEWAGFNLEANPQPPQVIALTQWREIISAARLIPHEGMSESELSGLMEVAVLAHKPLDFKNLANALALNGQPEAARLWIERLCRIETKRVCLEAKNAFETRQMEAHPPVN